VSIGRIDLPASPSEVPRATLPGVTETPHFLGDPDLYRRIVEDSPTAVVLLTNEATPRVLYATPSVLEISGFTPDELTSGPESWVSRLHPEEGPAIDAEWIRAVEDDRRFEVEYRFLHRDGQWRWFRETASIVRGDDGTIRYRQGFIQDITSERSAEAQARRSEARYRALVERLPVVVYVDTDEPDPRSLYVSPNSSETLGYPPESYLSDPSLWLTSMHEDDRARVHGAWAESIGTRAPFHAEYRALKPDGAIVWIRDEALVVRDEAGRALFWQGVLLDITAEREIEAMLLRSEARYQELIEHLPVIVYMDAYDDATSSRYVSPNVLEVLGYPAEAFIADTLLWAQLVHPDDLDRARTAWEHGWSTATGWSVEYRYVHPDGHHVWVRDEARMVVDPTTGGQTWQGVIVDLTDAKEAEVERKRSEQRYRVLVERVPAIVYEMGPDDERRTLFVSPHVEEILGYPRQEWLDQPDIWAELLHPEDRETELAAHDLHNETGRPWQREYRLIASDGREVWVRDHAELVTDAEGTRWLGVMIDISAQKETEELLRLAHDELEMRVLTRTAELEDANEMMGLEIEERRRVEAELRHADERLRAIVNHMPGVAYTWRVLWPGDQLEEPPPFMSPRIEDLLGYSVEEWQRSPTLWRERVHPHDRERVVAATEHTRRTGEPFNEEFRYLSKDGSIVWVLEQATLLRRDELGRPSHLQGVMLDITPRKQAEAAEERFRRLAELSPVVVYEFELERADDDQALIDVRYMSPNAERLLRMPIARWIGDVDAWFDHMHPDDVGWMRESARTAWATGGPWSQTFRMIAGDGQVVWVLHRGRSVERDAAGRPTLFQGVFIDVTDEQEAHVAMVGSESRFRSIVETMPAVPWSEVVDPISGLSRFVFIGPQVEAVFGYLPDELMMEPEHFFRMVHPEDRDRLRAASDRCDATGEPWDELYRVLHRDGSLRWIFSYATRTFEDDRPVWNGIAVDVTRHVEEGSIPLPVQASADADPA
jgi:adenylate cyclase